MKNGYKFANNQCNNFKILYNQLLYYNILKIINNKLLYYNIVKI